MSASLVGSEMCIRDSPDPAQAPDRHDARHAFGGRPLQLRSSGRARPLASLRRTAFPSSASSSWSSLREALEALRVLHGRVDDRGRGRFGCSPGRGSGGARCGGVRSCDRVQTGGLRLGRLCG
eukprot:250580-Alexandrium_andersonii.AAC.1